MLLAIAAAFMLPSTFGIIQATLCGFSIGTRVDRLFPKRCLPLGIILAAVFCITTAGPSLAQGVRDLGPGGRDVVNPPSTVDMAVDLTENGRLDGKPLKNNFARESDDRDCLKCPAMTLAAASAGMLRNWNDLDTSEFMAGRFPDDMAIVGQKQARAKLADRIEANPHAVVLSVVERSRLFRLLGRILVGQTLQQALAIIVPDGAVPELK